jgi:hypothetical protein
MVPSHPASTKIVLIHFSMRSIDVTNSFERRQLELNDRYAFTCACSKCTKGPTLQEDLFLQPLNELPSQQLAEIITHANKYVAKVHRIPANAPPTSVIKAIEDYTTNLIDECQHEAPDKVIRRLHDGLELLEGTKIWPIYRQPFPALYHELFVSYLNNKDYLPAFFQGLKTYFEVDPLLYPQTHHPTRVEHVWTLAMLTLFLAMEAPIDSSVDPIGFIQSAELAGHDMGYLMYGLMGQGSDNIGKSHGLESTFAKMVKNKFYEVTADMMKSDAVDLRAVHRCFLACLPWYKTMAVKHTNKKLLSVSTTAKNQESGTA